MSEDGSDQVTRRFRLTVAYDGRPFAGWQSQPCGRTVQDTLEKAFCSVWGTRPVRVVASGRTDAGVHALGQVVHFDDPFGKLAPEVWPRALNQHLPASVRIMDCRLVSSTFHARFDALGKTYRYRIWLGGVLPPLEAGLACHYPHRLDPGLVREVCALLKGSHDFSNFAAFRGNEDGSEDNRRELWLVEPQWVDELLVITFHGSGFLYKMVRLMVGAILRMGSGRSPLTWIEDLIHMRSVVKCSYVAPADGLYLESVDYPNHDNDRVG